MAHSRLLFSCMCILYERKSLWTQVVTHQMSASQTQWSITQKLVLRSKSHFPENLFKCHGQILNENSGWCNLSLMHSQLYTVACMLVLVHVLVHGKSNNNLLVYIQLTSHSNGGTTYCKYWTSIVHSTVVVSLTWVVCWDCEGQVGLSCIQVRWWNGNSPAEGHSLWWRWGHTTLEYHSGTNGKWTLQGIYCDGDLMVGRSCMRKRMKQRLLRIHFSEQFLTLTSHCSISAMMKVDCPHSTPTTLCNVQLSASTTEVAKNWTTAFSKVGASQRCGSCICFGTENGTFRCNPLMVHSALSFAKIGANEFLVLSGRNHFIPILVETVS